MDHRAVQLAFVHVGYCGMGGGGGVIEEVAEATIGIDWEGIGLVGRPAMVAVEKGLH